MMVENRFNAITLWTMHPFTYMIRPKNFPEASKWTDAEFAEWQHLYREIFRMAKERGLDTYVVFWSIFVSEEFAKAHGVATAELLSALLRARRHLGDHQALPARERHADAGGISRPRRHRRVARRRHGRHDAARSASSSWTRCTSPGALNAKRKQPVKLIHRVPFSSGLSSGPGVSADVEQITRTAMEKLGNKFDGPIWVEMKFNWSHGHSTPKLVKVHGGKLGDTYFKPTPSNYKIVWQVRNEDFFALRWGVPDFIRQHIALNGHAGLRRRLLRRLGNLHSRRSTTSPRSKEPVSWKWAFQRQWLFYKLWGRLLYDPETPDSRVPGRVHAPLRRKARQPAAGLRARVQHADAPGVAVRLALGLHAVRRRHARAAGRGHALHRRRCAHQAADDGSGVRLGGRLREDHAAPAASFGAGSHHAAAARRSARARLPRGARPGAAASTPPAMPRCVYEVADVQGLGATSACTWRRSCAARWRWQTYRAGGRRRRSSSRPSAIWRQALAYWDAAHRASRAPSTGHEAHALQRQFLRREPAQPVSLGADPRRSRAGTSTWRSNAARPAPIRRAAGPSIDPRPASALTLRSSAQSESRKASTWSFCAG